MNAFEEWKSLYTTEVENAWSSSRQELRKSAMVLFVLREEFQRVENVLKNQMVKFEQQFKCVDNSRPNLFDVKPRPSQKSDVSVEKLNKSPTLNQRRIVNRVRRPFLNSSLNNSKENAIATDVKVPNGGDYDDSSIFLSPQIEQSLDLLLPYRTKTATFKTPVKPRDNADVVDSSFIIEDSPVVAFTAKTKKSKLKNSQKNYKKPQTLTQIFSSLPLQSNKTVMVKNEKIVSESDDETFCEVAPPKKSFKADRNAFRDYDEFPKVKSTSPEYVHHGDRVRCKSDRLKLPGWSCDECKQFYESLNLSPGELRKKMDICSRHRNKFESLDTTRKGFWNAGMPLTQDDDVF